MSNSPLIFQTPQTTTQQSEPAEGAFSWRSEGIWAKDFDPATYAGFSEFSLEPAGSAAEVWGIHSTVSAQMRPRGYPVRVNDRAEPWQTTVIMVVLMCFYCYILYRFRRDIMSCLRNIAKTEDTLMLMDGQGADFAHFLYSGIFLLILSCSAIIMTWLESDVMPAVESYYLFGGAVATFTGVLACQWIARRVMCWFTQERGIGREIGFIEGVDVSLIALCYAPFAIIIGLSGRFFVPGLVILAALILYHFAALYKYFRFRAFSRLQYFLYLCTIEILPVSFAIALAVRNQ